jgi:hypothetical protein
VAIPSISLGGIGLRFVFALALVLFTWNPTRYNYVAWALAQWRALGPLVAFSGLVLLMGWIFFLRTTAKSLGVLGIVLSTALAATVLWILFFYHIVSAESSTLISWIVLVCSARFSRPACRGRTCATSGPAKPPSTKSTSTNENTVRFM